MKRHLRLVALAFGVAIALATASARVQASTPARQSEGARKTIPSSTIKLPRGQSEQPTEEKQAEASKTTVAHKWEYCAITQTWTKRRDYSSSSTGIAFIRYFPGGSEEVEGATEEEALNNALARLGEEGWELTAIRERVNLTDGNGTSYGMFYFKRPK